MCVIVILSMNDHEWSLKEKKNSVGKSIFAKDLQSGLNFWMVQIHFYEGDIGHAVFKCSTVHLYNQD